jgi:hypothetical protein
MVVTIPKSGRSQIIGTDIKKLWLYLGLFNPHVEGSLVIGIN